MSILPSEREKSDAERDSIVRVLFVAPLLTFGFDIVSVVGLVTLIPRHKIGGGRFVPAIGWPTYGLLGNLIPFAISLFVLALLYRRPRHRVLAWILAALTCYIAHEMFVTNLLRRDFIGKF
ncbi:hypothetical protein [Rhodopirellula bahusiensis]|uniref:hypothetical protein n=1 Tax=Rhodopirellula bahusiensis TaxID=2014065 RepID=UPI003263480C